MRFGHLLCMPRRPRGDVCKSPSRFKLQSGLIIHRQKGHEAGQQPSVYDLLQRRVTLLWKQLPEEMIDKRFFSFPYIARTCSFSSSPMGSLYTDAHLWLDRSRTVWRLTWLPDSLGSETACIRCSLLWLFPRWISETPEWNIRRHYLHKFGWNHIRVTWPFRWRCSPEIGPPRLGATTALCSFSSGNSRSCEPCAAPRTPWSFSHEVSARVKDAVLNDTDKTRVKTSDQLTAGSLPLFLNLEIRSSTTFLVGMLESFTHFEYVESAWRTLMK